MELLGLLLLVMLSSAGGAWLMKAYLESTSSQREAVMRHELTALRAAQHINFAAWRSRLALYDIASESSTSPFTDDEPS